MYQTMASFQAKYLKLRHINIRPIRLLYHLKNMLKMFFRIGTELYLKLLSICGIYCACPFDLSQHAPIPSRSSYQSSQFTRYNHTWSSMNSLAWSYMVSDTNSQMTSLMTLPRVRSFKVYSYSFILNLASI